MLLDESVDFFGFASVVVSDLQSGLDANDVLCDLDRVKTATSGADDGDRLIRSELGARDEGARRGEDGVCGDGRWGVWNGSKANCMFS